DRVERQEGRLAAELPVVLVGGGDAPEGAEVSPHHLAEVGAHGGPDEPEQWRPLGDVLAYLPRVVFDERQGLRLEIELEAERTLHVLHAPERELDDRFRNAFEVEGALARPVVILAVAHGCSVSPSRGTRRTRPGDGARRPGPKRAAPSSRVRDVRQHRSTRFGGSVGVGGGPSGGRAFGWQRKRAELRSMGRSVLALGSASP